MSTLRPRLTTLLKDSIITDDRVDLAAYRDIAVPDAEIRDAVVVVPGTKEDVLLLLGFCNQQKIPLVPWGGGTNLCAALSPEGQHVVLDLRRLDRVLNVDSVNGTLRVQAGATIIKVQEAAKKEGCLFGHDPWSRRSATVGGSIALDAAGTLFSRFGSMGGQVLALKVALPSGEVLELGKGLSKCSSGPPLFSLFIGSEGALGIILEATLRIHPQIRVFKPKGFGFPDFQRMFHGLQALRESGLLPDSFIGGTLPKRVTVELPKAERLLIKVGKIGTGLYLCCCGEEGEAVDSKLERIRAILKLHKGKQLPQDYADEWWQERHTYFEASPEVTQAELYPHVLDLTLPHGKVLEMKNWVAQEVEKAGFTEALSHTLFTTSDAYTVAFYLRKGENVDELSMRIYEKAVEMGGTVARTHGTGRLFPEELAQKELGDSFELLRKLKFLLDPKGILNPGVMGLDDGGGEQ